MIEHLDFHNRNRRVVRYLRKRLISLKTMECGSNTIPGVEPTTCIVNTETLI